MVDVIKTHCTNLQERKGSVDRWNVPDLVKADVLAFLEGLAIGRVNRGKRISDERQAKYVDLLRVPLEFINKPVSAFNLTDIEDFEKALASDEIQPRKGHTDYAHSTKADIRKALRIFLRWKRGPAEALLLAGWLDTRPKQKTPQYLTEREVEKLLHRCHTAAYRFAIVILFDSGARAAEFLNLRLEDIHVPEGKDNFARITLREEFSKTKGRTISLYWRNSLTVVQDYLNQRIKEGVKPTEPVFEATYGALRMFLRRLGESTLTKRIHPHLFRHTSATFYASKLNRQELCYRYGWKFSSNMPDVYISRAGMENKNLDEKFTNTELGELRDQLNKVEQGTKLKDETIQGLQRELAILKENMSAINEVLALRPTLSAVQKELERRRSRTGADVVE